MARRDWSVLTPSPTRLVPAPDTLVWRARFLSRVYVLDGATGTELERRGVPTDGPLWASTAIRSHPKVVSRIHRAYISAGADIITTDTFRLSSAALRADRRRRRLKVTDTLVEKDRVRLHAQAVRLVRDAIPRRRPSKSTPVIAGGIGPCADCYRPERTPPERILLRQYIRRTYPFPPVDFFLFETLGTLLEAAVAANRAWTFQCPCIVSVMLRESGELLGGGTLEELVAAITQYHPAAIGLNCIPPRAISVHLRRLRMLTDLPIAVYGHINNAQPLPGWSYAQRATPEEYAAYAREWRQDGANIIGGCCGTTPAHIAAVVRVVHGVPLTPRAGI